MGMLHAGDEMKRRGALYEKAELPFVWYAISDGNLVTGHNSGSGKPTARTVVGVRG